MGLTSSVLQKNAMHVEHHYEGGWPTFCLSHGGPFREPSVPSEGRKCLNSKTAGARQSTKDIGSGGRVVAVEGLPV